LVQRGRVIRRRLVARNVNPMCPSITLGSNIPGAPARPRDAPCEGTVAGRKEAPKLLVTPSGRRTATAFEWVSAVWSAFGGGSGFSQTTELMSLKPEVCNANPMLKMMW
jgi:hypothetical protein